jgi:hypothetical protein
MAERFNAPGILRMLDAEAKAAFSGERTKIEVVARFIRALVAENKYVRARLELETAALEQACAAPVDQPLTVQAARGTVETTRCLLCGNEAGTYVNKEVAEALG